MTNPESQRLRLTYDTQLNPVSFDFVMCLAICRAFCHLHKLPNTFDVVLVNRGFRDMGVEGKYSLEYSERKVRDVLISSASLCKWVNSLKLVRGETPVEPYEGPVIPLRSSLQHIGRVPQWQVTPMVPKQLEAVFSNGGRLPEAGFAASEAIKQHYRDKLKNAVVIHPRVSAFTPARNTDKALVTEVARKLRTQGLDVYFVPDVEDVRGTFTWWDFEGQPLLDASYDLECRIGAAECAQMNLISGGGNTWMLQFSAAPFVVMGFLDEAERVTSSAFFDEKGPAIGQTHSSWMNPATQFRDWTLRASVTPDSIFEHILRTIDSSRAARG